MSPSVQRAPALSPAVFSLLRCPACTGTLVDEGRALRCTACGKSYPRTASGAPILIDESTSVFDCSTFVEGSATFFKPHGRLFRLVRAFVPEVIVRPKTRRNLGMLRALLLKRDSARVLVVGGSIRGEGMDQLVDPRIELVESDAAVGPYTALVCDAHSIPFAGASFDAVLAQCVLEHVADPDRCVAEFHRVLRPDGLVYAETAFLQHVHGGRYDFVRYSELGHRRLFRRFDAIESGAMAGPGTVLTWAWEQLLLTLVPARRLRNVVKALARLSAFFVKYIDYLILDRPAALDGASAVYFLGTRSEKTLTDRELITLYRGNDA